MFYLNAMKLFACFGISTALAHTCVAQKLKTNNERTQKMNHIKESHHASEWLTVVRNQAASDKSGQIFAVDAQGKSVVIEWHITDILSPELATFKKCVADFAAHTHAVSEVQFLHKYPEAVSQDGFLKSCAPLFAQSVDAVDWKQVEETIQKTYKQFYIMDIASFGAEIIKRIADDLYFFAMIKEVSGESEKILGFMMTAITPALAFGDVKLIKLAVDPAVSNHNLDALLLSSLFKVIPQIKRIFTMIRPTDENVYKTYTSWGFVHDVNPVQDPNHPINVNYLTVLEYKIDQSDVLQTTANALKR